MANNYITPAQFYVYCDVRLKQISGDLNSTGGNSANVLAILDAAAGLHDSYIAGHLASVPIPQASVPEFSRWLISKLAEEMLFGRRPGIPKDVTQMWDRATQWLKEFREGLVQYPGIDRSAVPRLVDSSYTNGRSQFDHVFGQCVTDTSPSRGQ